MIGGTGYTGEMKKGIFSALNFILPVDKKHLAMHCSANVGNDGDTAIFFGLSEQENYLISRSKRKLIGDDEHGWTNENTVFILKAVATKVINLSEENEPDILEQLQQYPRKRCFQRRNK
jgi:phosphoenolpyruvate carboxykinase (ATP)